MTELTSKELRAQRKAQQEAERKAKQLHVHTEAYSETYGVRAEYVGGVINLEAYSIQDGQTRGSKATAFLDKEQAVELRDYLDRMITLYEQEYGNKK